jgi:sulfate permease, SulP family
VVAVEGPLFYANAATVKKRLVEALEAAEPKPAAIVLDLARNDEIDVQSLDMLGELADELAARQVELRLAGVHVPVLELLRRSGLAERVRIEPTLDAAVRDR